jgi:hypothetical protein
VYSAAGLTARSHALSEPEKPYFSTLYYIISGRFWKGVSSLYMYIREAGSQTTADARVTRPERRGTVIFWGNAGQTYIGLI